MFTSAYRRILRTFTWVVAMLFAQSAYASFHLWKIAEIYSNASGTVQYVVLATTVAGQQFVHGHQISTSQNGAAYSYTFPTDLPGDYGSDYYFSSQKFLIATQGFANLGVVTPDYVVPDGFLFQPNGSVDFAGVDVMTYSALPSDGVSALDRSGNIVVNAPTNFQGATGTIGALQVLPQCTLSAIPAVIPAGASSTLTPSCSPVATSYVWTGGTCVGTTAPTCTVTPIATTAYTVTGIIGSGTGLPAAATVTVNALISQTISFTNPGVRTLGEAPFVLSATGGGSGNPVTFTSQTSIVCTVSGSTVTVIAAGTCSVAANQGGSASYSPAPQVLQSFTVSSLISQTISFTSPGIRTLGEAPFVLSATGGASGTPVTFTSQTSSVCEVSGNTVILIAVGTCTVAAKQSGNAGYSPAPQVTQNITVLAAATPASAPGQYDGIYQWSPSNYLSIHQHGGRIIATIYFNADGSFNFNSPDGRALPVRQLDIFDLLSGPIVGSIAKMAGTRFHRACNEAHVFVFDANDNITVTKTAVSNTAAADLAGISCAAITDPVGTVLVVPKILF